MRDVVPVRLGNAEREQIAQAAARRELALSSFIREAALAASAIVQKKVTVRTQAPRERRPRELKIVDPEPPRGRWIEGEWVTW